MRLRFYAPGDDVETAFLLAQMANVDALWKRFRGLANDAERTHESVWLPELRNVLGEISPELGLEVRRDEAGTRSLFVVPLCRGPSAILAHAVVERAPSVLLWNFAVWRPAVALEAALQIVRQDSGIDLTQARARVGVGRGHAIEVVIGSHFFGGIDDQGAIDAAERLVNALLGDELFDRWIADVRVIFTPRPGPLRVVGQDDTTLTLKLSEILPAVVAAQRGVSAGLPELPCHAFCERADWLLFEMDDLREVKQSAPKQGANDVEEQEPVLHQDDVQVATTMCPEMLRCLLAGSTFASERFSRHGEQFCYLKLALAGNAEERVARRVALEETLDRALVPGGLGCVVGAGVGEQYMYINLCLQKPDPALRLIQRRLREAQVERDSWVLFCDTELADEWIGVWEDSPAPGWASTHSSSFLDVFS